MRQSVRNGDRDATGEHGSLIALARAQNYYVKALPDGIFEIEDRCADARTFRFRGTAAEAHRYLRGVAQRTRA
jgi:hypothetical protein